MRLSGAFLLALMVFLAGCHRYVPARVGSVPQGTEVKVHISDDGARRLGELTGRESREVTGMLERWAEDVVVSVRVPPAPGVMDRALRQRVVVTPEEVVAVEVRERDRTRTAILTAGVVTVVGGALIAAFTGLFGGSRNDDPPVEEDARVPPFGSMPGDGPVRGARPWGTVLSIPLR